MSMVMVLQQIGITTCILQVVQSQVNISPQLILIRIQLKVVGMPIWLSFIRQGLDIGVPILVVEVMIMVKM